MDPRIESFLRTLALLAIALFVILAYFNGWG
jgi:hypothetical protein